MINVHFLRPAWLLLWALIIPLGFLLWQSKHKSAAWQGVCDPHLLPHLLTSNGDDSWGLQRAWLLFWFVGILALAGPSWHALPQPVYQAERPIVLALDLSSNSLVQDLPPNRFTRAKYKISDILTTPNIGQIGMIAFTKEAYTVSPLTQDARTIRAMLDDLSPAIMPVDGHQIKTALVHAKRLLEQSGHHTGEILVFSSSTPTAEDIKISRRLGKKGFHVSVLGVGTPQGGPIPSATGFRKDAQGNIQISRLNATDLLKLAQAGHGRYRAIDTDNQDIEQLMTTPHIPLHFKKTQQNADRWQDQGYLLTWLLLPIAALAFRRGWAESC